MVKKYLASMRGRLLIVVIVVLVVLAADYVCYKLVMRMLMANANENFEELADYGERAVEDSFNNILDKVTDISSHIAIKHSEDLLSVQLNLSDCENFLPCVELDFADDSGHFISSKLRRGVDERLGRLCSGEPDRFFKRVANPKADIDGRAEYFIAGAAIDPIDLEGYHLTHILAILDISTIESAVKTECYGGAGYCSVIDADGSYIVMPGRSYDVKAVDNFYDRLSQCVLSGGDTIESVQAKMASRQHFTMGGIDPDGVEVIRGMVPFARTDWYYSMVVPVSVFERQSINVTKVFLLLSVILIIVVIFAAVLYIRIYYKQARDDAAHSKELAEALDKANLANRAKTTFLSNMSHDIRTPMNAVVGYTDLAKKHLGEDARVSEYLDKISSSSAYLLSLINDVLDMSYIESGQMKLDQRPCSIREVIDRVIAIAKVSIDGKHQHFNISVDIKHEYVYLDKVRFFQVMLNVLSNCTKFTPEGGTIGFEVLESTDCEEGIVLCNMHISDTGIGMSKNFIRQIYEPFTREHNSTVSGIQGTGLGMSIAKKIIDLTGGSIKITSVEGKGSDFYISLPHRIAEAADVEEIEEPAVPDENLEGLRVLLVEDNEINRDIATEILTSQGLNVDSAQNGQIAVDMVERSMAGTYDVILMDIQMPVMDGLTATRNIRALEDTDKSGLPIIAMTANAFDSDRATAKAAGMDAFVTKPIDAQALLGAISTAVRRRRLYGA